MWRANGTLSFLVLFIFAPCVNAALLTARCAAALDLMNQALERVGPDSPNDAVRDGNELLKRSEQMCSELGDTWYYRSLFEAKLGNAGGAKFSLSQASRLGSEALKRGVNPFVLATPKGGGPPVPLKGGTRWALVVGISKFLDPNIKALRFTADDASLFARTLEGPSVGGFPADHVRVLLDTNATTVAVRESLNWIARSAKPEDVVVIYFATHGSAGDWDSVAGANYLITADTTFNRDPDLLNASSLPMNDLVNTVTSRISALRTAIFIDACYSGSAGAARGESVSLRDLARFGPGTGRIIMSAARADQESHESDELRHGYFTYFLTQALSEGGAAHMLSQVYQKVASQVAERVAKDTSPMSKEQNPVLNRSSDQTDFALGPGA